ncbi:MAG TPA: DUF2079 domain-containing protein [Verrucomicrobiae bacterium]|nr:DUF2079 domain-containing protein [Verrucomicrobiae bacterium]
MTIVVLVGFWFLLGYRYSPENYLAKPNPPYVVELTWFGAALVAAACGLIVLPRRRDCWIQVVHAGWPMTASCLWVLTKVLFHAPLRTYDMMLFAVACGWTTLLWLRERDWKIDRFPAPILFPAVWSAIALLALYQFGQQVGYWNDLALGYADCGENARLMFNTITNPHALFLRVNPNKPLFYDHFCPGILPFTPLWLLWPSLKLTMVLEIVVVFGVAVPLYYIGQRVFRNQAAALFLVLAWIVYPSASQFIYSASYGFRWGNVCLLLYFIALASWLSDHPRWALAMAIWAMLIKEEAAIIVGMFGVYLALFEHRRLAGIVLAVFAFGYFFLATSVLIPVISGESYAMTRFFYNLGHTEWEIVWSPITKPAVFWGDLFESSSFYFAAALVGPLLFLPLRKPSILFIGALTFLFCCLNPMMKSIATWYQATVLPVVFFALVRAVRDWAPQRRNHALMSVVIAGGVFSIFLGAQPWSKATLTIHRSPGRLQLVRRFGEHIDPHGTLFATQRVAAHFITQRYVYLDPPVPESADYSLIDLRDSWRGGTGELEWLDKYRQLQKEIEANPRLHLVAVDDGLLLYSRSGSPLNRQKLVERETMPPSSTKGQFDLGGGVSIAGFTATPLPRRALANMDRVRITTYSDIAAKTNLDLAVRCIVRIGTQPDQMNSFASEFQPLGQGVWPISQWKTNRYYADDFIVILPSGLVGSISDISFTAKSLSP